MATIGIVTKTAQGFRGKLQTLLMKASITIVPNEDKTAEGQLDFRVLANGGFELGAAWVRRNHQRLHLLAPEEPQGRRLRAPSCWRPHSHEGTHAKSGVTAIPALDETPHPTPPPARQSVAGERFHTTSPGKRTAGISVEASINSGRSRSPEIQVLPSKMPMPKGA